MRAILEEALKIAERCSNPDDRDAIVKMVGDISSMTDALCELRSAGKVRLSSSLHFSMPALCRSLLSVWLSFCQSVNVCVFLSPVCLFLCHSFFSHLSPLLSFSVLVFGDWSVFACNETFETKQKDLIISPQCRVCFADHRWRR